MNPDDDLMEEADDDIVAARVVGTASGSPGWGRPWIIGAVLVGIVIGVWMVGKPVGEEPAEAVPATAGTIDPVARQAELEAQVALDPDDVDSRLELGVILFNKGDIESARLHWEHVTVLDPSLAEAWYDLGFYYLSLDPPDYDGAEKVWDKVVALDPASELAQTVQAHMAGLFGDSAASTEETLPPDGGQTDG